MLKLMSLQGPSHIQATTALGLLATVSHVLAMLRSSCPVMLSPPSSHVQWIIKTIFTVAGPDAVCAGNGGMQRAPQDHLEDVRK